MKKLESEVQYLKQLLSEHKQTTEVKQFQGSTNIRKDLTPAEQVSLQRELQQLDLLVKTYQDENRKYTSEKRD